jgi:ADP-ribosyl-[dinitrogen reductase] hydrolase
MNSVLSRAQGCLLGQLAGDSLGSLVEFMDSDEILESYPKGVRELADGGTFDLLAGQPTDDSEMALLLARVLIEKNIYNPDVAKKAYLYWLNSNPFDIGNTILNGLLGKIDYDSQANGALMRISPLGIFGVNHDLQQVAEWAKQDARITHPHPICQQINALYTVAISQAIKIGPTATGLYEMILESAREMDVDNQLMEVIVKAKSSPPSNYLHLQGWVLIAFQNALWHLVNTYSLEEAVVSTVMQGGDTDTNAAICGALLGAVYGIEHIPEQWLKSILSCRPSIDNPKAKNPRPESLWPVNALVLAKELINL